MPSLRPLLRLPVQIVIWAMLLLVALAPRRSVEVCTGDCCAAAAASGHACECCSHCDAAAEPCAAQELSAEAAEEGTTAESTGPDQNRARFCGNCRISVSLSVELGPLPQTVSPGAGALACLGLASDAARPGNQPETDGIWPFDTGPPRPDPKARLIATTNLRL